MPSHPPPSCFLSYSWDNPEHCAWVLRLAEDLAANGVLVALDRYQPPGSSLTSFMESAIRDSDIALLVCTPLFADKANNRTGGVGYETQVVTGELFDKIVTSKFVPILRSGSLARAIPSYLKGLKAIDFRSTERYEAALTELVRHIWNKPELPHPIPGEIPTFGHNFTARRASAPEIPVRRTPPTQAHDGDKWIRPATRESFAEMVLSARNPVLVEFWAPWCGPCRVVRPVLEEIAAPRQGVLDVVCVNTDEETEIAAKYQVLSIPTMIAFSGGVAEKTVIGAYPKKKLEDELRHFLPEPNDEEQNISAPLVALTLYGNRIKLVSLQPDGRYSFLDANEGTHRLLYLPQRIRSQTRRAIEELEELLNDSYTTKLEVKKFLEEHPRLILGGEYRSARSQVFLRRDGLAPLSPDFLLEPIAGELADIVEIEPANHELSTEIDGIAQLSEVVVEACGRLRAYRDYFEDDRRRVEIEDEHGISAFRPRMFVVVGRTQGTDPVARRRLETQLNDVCLRTWDDVLQVARAQLEL